MPITRVIGNIFFSLIGNILIKSSKIFDFLNGFTAINNKILKEVLKRKLDDDYYFDTALIYNLSKMNVEILDINMEAIYEGEKSNINIFKTGSLILYKNIKLFFKN